MSDLDDALEEGIFNTSDYEAFIEAQNRITEHCEFMAGLFPSEYNRWFMKECKDWHDGMAKRSGMIWRMKK